MKNISYDILKLQQLQDLVQDLIDRNILRKDKFVYKLFNRIESHKLHRVKKIYNDYDRLIKTYIDGTIEV